MGKDKKTQSGLGRGRTSSSRTGRGKAGSPVKPPILREFSSGGVVFKKDGDKVLWLVCKSNPSEKYPGDFWRLAKGWIDDSDDGNKPGPISRGEKKATEEDLVTTATREVKEEGGVEAKIVKKIGSFRYFIGRKLKFVTFYLMEFIRDLPEGFGFETERIEWLPIDEAVGRVDLKIEKDILKKAGEVLGSGIQNSLI